MTHLELVSVWRSCSALKNQKASALIVGAFDAARKATIPTYEVKQNSLKTITNSSDKVSRNQAGFCIRVSSPST
jgi:hypothetical protein